MAHDRHIQAFRSGSRGSVSLRSPRLGDWSEHALGVGRQVEVTRDALRAAGDREELSGLLDAVAADAAAGSLAAVELLVWAVDELALAHPTIRRLVLDESDVDDVAQDVLVAVAETIRSFRGEARFTTWLHQVARFKSIAQLRRKRDESRLDDLEPTDAARISSMLASRVVLQQLLDGLPDHYRGAVVLRDVEQLPYDEITRRLGINLNTAKSRVARGRALVAARLVER
jgi:RNA polymerase sigma-70 factor, ECF subfamily